jgi:hypothetical protein
MVMVAFTQALRGMGGIGPNCSSANGASGHEIIKYYR